ncbi:MAG: hypothetical protein M1828_005177 [Chrysothrix sp. TS-e1954]|nr:MAG: hypothetical protein M1828_005177 [Chrysothrix sp. TS-e1954]
MPPSRSSLDADSRRRVRDALQRLRTLDDARELLAAPSTASANAPSNTAATPAQRSGQGLEDQATRSHTESNDADNLQEGTRRLQERSETLRLLLNTPLTDSNGRTRGRSPEAEVNAGRRKRRRTLGGQSTPEEVHSARDVYGHEGQVVPGRLRMELVSSDGGIHHSKETLSLSPDMLRLVQGPEKILEDDDTVYCTSSPSCNIVLKHRHETPFTLDKLVIKAPKVGCTDPVQEGLVFLAMDKDSAFESTAQYQVSHYLTSRFGPFYPEKDTQHDQRPSRRSNPHDGVKTKIRISDDGLPYDQEPHKDYSGSSSDEDDDLQGSLPPDHPNTHPDDITAQIDFDQLLNQGNATTADRRNRAASNSRRDPCQDPPATDRQDLLSPRINLLKPIAHFSLLPTQLAIPAYSTLLTSPDAPMPIGAAHTNAARRASDDSRRDAIIAHFGPFQQTEDSTSRIAHNGDLMGRSRPRPALRRTATVRPVGDDAHPVPRISPPHIHPSNGLEPERQLELLLEWDRSATVQIIRVGRRAGHTSQLRQLAVVNLVSGPQWSEDHSSIWDDLLGQPCSEHAVQLIIDAVQWARGEHPQALSESDDDYGYRLLRRAHRVLQRIGRRAELERSCIQAGLFEREIHPDLVMRFIDQRMQSQGFSSGHTRDYYATPSPEPDGRRDDQRDRTPPEDAIAQADEQDQGSLHEPAREPDAPSPTDENDSISVDTDEEVMTAGPEGTNTEIDIAPELSTSIDQIISEAQSQLLEAAHNMRAETDADAPTGHRTLSQLGRASSLAAPPSNPPIREQARSHLNSAQARLAHLLDEMQSATPGWMARDATDRYRDAQANLDRLVRRTADLESRLATENPFPSASPSAPLAPQPTTTHATPPPLRPCTHRNQSKLIGNTAVISFDPPVSGRYLLLKLWNPRKKRRRVGAGLEETLEEGGGREGTVEGGGGREGNIDVKCVECWGWSGRRWMPALEMR